MVFEAVVSSQLNKFLGAYIENLNSSQLKLGLLGGDVVLKTLILKQSALDDLNLPVKTVAGHISELILKIPWTNIYKERTQVIIKGLYLLAIPNQAVVYDAEKEKMAAMEAKQKQLALIEEAKLRESSGDAPIQEDDGFVAKLAAQILQNLTVTVEDVHIRFEDSVTNPKRPFAVGVTLKKLALESTDSFWKPTVISEPSKQFFKLLSLESLSLYWLSNTPSLLHKMTAAEQVNHFKNGIASGQERPFEDSYIAGPITSYAKLRINTRPELDGSNYSIPKIFLNLTMEEISIGLTPNQYEDIILLLNSVERMNRGIPYRKYRPVIQSYKKYGKYWWLFAYQCILEGTVRRRRRNWRWSHIKNHRDMVHNYIKLYKTKLTQKKEDLRLKKNLEELEENLDVFNITLARRQAEVQVDRDRSEQRIKEEAEAKSGGRGWFGGWFGGTASTVSSASETESVIKSLQAEVTPAEKAKLYSAIGYEENAAPAIYPKSFVENRFEFCLKKLAILLHDSSNVEEPVILLSSLNNVEATVEQRPVAKALEVHVRVRDFLIEGSPMNGETPRLVRPFQTDKEILDLVYETNPMDESCNQRIRMTTEPLVVTYDIHTLRRANAMFQSKEASQLQQLQAAAKQKLEDLKKTSSLGLEYAIQTHTVLDVDIKIKGSYIIMPYGGYLENNCAKILCNMGNFFIKSLGSRKRNEVPRVSQMIRAGSTEEDIMKEMLSLSYDKFSVDLQNVQVISVLPNEDWTVLLDQKNQHFFILKPMSISLVVEKCLLLDDPRLPKLKIAGQLPYIHLDVVDTRLVNMASVLKSIPPLTSSDVELKTSPSELNMPSPAVINSDSAFEHLENAFRDAASKEVLVQATELLLAFEFQDIRVSLSVDQNEVSAKPVVSFSMNNLEMKCENKTFETDVKLTLKDLSLEYVDHLAAGPDEQKRVTIITSRNDSKELLSVRFLDVNKQSPEFSVRHKSVLKKLDVVISCLACDFHQEAVIDLMKISGGINSRIESINATKTKVVEPTALNTNTTRDTQTAKALALEEREKKKLGIPFSEDVDFQLTAQFNSFCINMLTRQRRLTEITVGGLEVETSVRASHTVFTAGLKQFQVVNPNGDVLYREIASIQEGQAVKIDVKIFNGATENENYVNMDAVDLAVNLHMSRLKAVYLSSYIRDVLAFIDHFQAAKEALIEASTAAASAARQNVERVYVQATRILLSIEIQAPYIIIPQTSNSTDALVVDLGHLTMKNRFDLRNVRNEIGSPAIVDSINLSLEELRIHLAVVSSLKIQPERDLIKPLTFNLNVVRNLTTTWYTDEPDLKVDAQLGQVNIILSQDMYGKVMKIVFDNLAEGQTPAGGMELETDVSHQGFQLESTNTTLDESVQSTVSSPSSELSIDSILQRYAAPRVSMAFDVTLAEIRMELFVNVMSKKEMTFAMRERPLSKLSVQGFNVSGQIMSDQSIQAKIALRELLIEDTRLLHQSGFSSPSTPSTPTTPRGTPKRLVERPINRLLHLTEPARDKADQQMLTINFDRNKQADSNVDVHLNGFTLILCPNYLLRLLTFFTSGLPKSEVTSATTAVTSTAASSKSQHAHPSVSTTTQAVRGKKQPTPPSSLLTVVVVVDKPDIILVERIDTLNTNALMLNMEMKLTLLMMPQALDISGEISKLHVFSCLFDPALRSSSMATVLSPCWLTVKAKMSDDEKGGDSQVNINIGDVTLSVSPYTIEMLANVLKSMAVDENIVRGEKEEEDDEEEEEELRSMAIWSHLWDMRPLSCFCFPFLETEVAVEAHEMVMQEEDSGTVGCKTSSDLNLTRKRKEAMIVAFNQFTMMIETGKGNRTSPLILMESSMIAKLNNWSSALEASATLNLQVAYYNSAYSVWEPVLEPVDCTSNGSIEQRSWELTMKVKKHEMEEMPETFEFETECSSRMEITFESGDSMELTITRSFLDVISMLGDSFRDAVKQKLSKRDQPAALYAVHNQLDKKVVLDFDKCDFTVDDSSSTSHVSRQVLEPGDVMGLKLKTKSHYSFLNEQENESERLLAVEIPELNYSRSIPVSRSSRRYLPAGNRSEKGENVGIVADISNDFGFRSITLRGVVQIRNHFHQPIDIYYMTKSGNEVNQVGRVEECGVLNVPLFALYTPTGELFFSPLGHGVTTSPFVWRDLQRQSPINKVLQCSPRQQLTGSPSDPFFIQVTGNVERIFMEETRKKTLTSSCYEIHLRPTVILHNSLPIPIFIATYGTTSEVRVMQGESRILSMVETGACFVIMKLKNYMERNWACKEEVRPMPPELAVWSFISYDGTAKAALDLGVFSVVKDQTLHMTVYCPFWMINNTGHLLTYKGDEDNCLYHPENMSEPVLFSFRPKSFFGKKTAAIRVADSHWSDRFSLDAAGSGGLVTCKSSDEDNTCYQLGVTVQLSHGGLTKQVIFTSYYILSNLAPFDIEVCEVHEIGSRRSSSASTGAIQQKRWITVPAGKSVPFWPQGSQKWAIFRVAHTTEETLALSLDDPKTTLLRLDNGHGGLFIDFQVSESSVVIVCHAYEEGQAPLLLVNHSNSSIAISESNDGSTSIELTPQHAIYYTWRQPNGSRSLSWSSGGQKKQVGTLGNRDVTRSGSGFFDSPDGEPLHWVSFLFGRQRILLFTVDQGLAIQQHGNPTGHEPVEQSVNIKLHGLGLSLVDNLYRREIMYIGITSSGVIWEGAKMNRLRPIYRALSIRQNALLEDAYQQYLRLLVTTAGNAGGQHTCNARRELDGGRLVVDFNEWRMFKPKERHIRRSYRSGVELEYSSYSHRRMVHARLNKLQIDNQLDDCIFPIVLAPVPPPRSMATESIPHPFLEISIVELLDQRSGDVSQYEYVKLLVQEFHARIDMSLVNALGTLFVNDNDLKSEYEHKRSVELDIESAKQGLHERTHLLNSKAPENYFKQLHLSPLKIHLSFSNTGGGGALSSAQQAGSTSNPASQLLNLIVQSVGVSLTEVQDVVFRLGFFERTDTFMSWQQLLRDLQWHYTGQAIKQFYVLVFGLDVIGNPFGLALGISQGVEQLFYEPFQGAIQGPAEFVEGLALGARSLIGHTVGGMAGSVSRIAGTLGKGLSYLTFDEEYQKNRRGALLRRPTDFGESVAQGGKGLLMGVVEGVSGIVMRPIEGAQQQGVGGFFTGIGKGVVGLVARPSAAIADFASGSFDAMKKAADVNEELSRLRPPRFLNPDGITRSYIRYQADGDSLLKVLDKGRFSKTDHYVDHVVTDSKAVLLVTNCRLLLMSLDMFGQWQVDWGHTWEELTEPPQPNPSGLYIPLRHAKKVLGLFTSSESGKLIAIQSQKKCQIIREKVEKLMKT